MTEEAEIKPSKYMSQMKKLAKLLPKLREETDLGVVLVSCSYLDALLRDMLSSFLIESGNTSRLLEGPLRSFGARIMAAYSMGIINKVEIDHLNNIADIRNLFAHEFDMNFKNTDVMELCEKLYIKHMGTEDDSMLPIFKFRIVAIDLITKFGNRVDYLKDERLETEDWDTVKW